MFIFFLVVASGAEKLSLAEAHQTVLGLRKLVRLGGLLTRLRGIGLPDAALAAARGEQAHAAELDNARMTQYRDMVAGEAAVAQQREALAARERSEGIDTAADVQREVQQRYAELQGQSVESGAEEGLRALRQAPVLPAHAEELDEAAARAAHDLADLRQVRAPTPRPWVDDTDTVIAEGRKKVQDTIDRIRKDFYSAPAMPSLLESGPGSLLQGKALTDDFERTFAREEAAGYAEQRRKLATTGKAAEVHGQAEAAASIHAAAVQQRQEAARMHSLAEKARTEWAVQQEGLRGD